METGTIIFFKPTTWIGVCIVFFINLKRRLYKEPVMPYSHVGRVIVLEGRTFLCEALEGGVRISFLSKRLAPLAPSDYCVKYPVAPRPEEVYKEIGLYYLGVKYDFRGTLYDQLRKQLLEFLYAVLSKCLGVKIANKLVDTRWRGKTGTKADEAMYCSEYAAKWDDHIFTRPYEIDPEDLYFSAVFKF